METRVGKVDSSGTSTYKRDGAEVTDPVLSDGTIAYTPGTSERKSGATTFDQASYLGTFTRETNSSQATTATRVYDAFGNLEPTTGIPQSPFGFVGRQGYQEDSDSGLKLLGHRYFDPLTGRFLTRDPAMVGQSWFSYCSNNPLRQVDPSGLMGWTIEMDVNFVVAVANGDVETIVTLIEIITEDELPAEAIETIAELPGPIKPVRINGNTIRDVKKLVQVARAHIVKIAKDPTNVSVNHWRGEIRAAMINIYKKLPKQ